MTDSTANNAESIAELRIATDRLGDQVSTLSLALQTVNYLQEQQQRVDQEMMETRATAEEQRDLAGHLINTLDDKASTLDLARLRKLNRRVWGMVGLGAFALIVAVVSGYLANEHSIQAVARARVAICEQRNAQTLAASQRSHDYFAPKLATEEANPHADPVLVSILRALATAPPQLLKCR